MLHHHHYHSHIVRVELPPTQPSSCQQFQPTAPVMPAKTSNRPEKWKKTGLQSYCYLPPRRQQYAAAFHSCRWYDYSHWPIDADRSRQLLGVSANHCRRNATARAAQRCMLINNLWYKKVMHCIHIPVRNEPIQTINDQQGIIASIHSRKANSATLAAFIP